MRDFNSLSMSLCQACQKSNSALHVKEGYGKNGPAEVAFWEDKGVSGHKNQS